MLRSKSRSGAFDFGAKNPSSILSRTFSASKICRGDPLIDREALVSVVDRRPSAKIVTSSEDRIVRISTMQHQMRRMEEELKLRKNQLDAAGEERDRALDELRDSKLVAHEANMRLSEALSPRKAGQVLAELLRMKELLSNSQKELTIKEKNMESIKVELEQAKQFEIKLADRDASLSRLNEELHNVKASETRAMNLLSETKQRIAKLEAELYKGKLSESEMLESVESQMKQLEVNKIELEESKLEIASLRERMEKLQSSKEINGFHNSEHIGSTESEFECLKSELQLAKENLTPTQEGEKSASLRANNVLHEMEVLKSELKAAIEGEEKSTKAMDDLALALKEVATQANQAKEKLSSTEVEVERARREVEQLKVALRSAKDRYEKLLQEAKKESELHQNTVNRLRLEAEESLLAWNGKEMGFVGVIKRVEEEKAHAQQDNARLTESLLAAEKVSRSLREENFKLRDILKQALNEANVAKEASAIAKGENSQLKDSLGEKDEALHFLARENERLRIDEAAAHGKMKRLLAAAYTELKSEDKEESGMDSVVFMSSDHKEDAPPIKKGFSFDLNEIKLYNKHEDGAVDEEEEDPVKAEALKGSIFDPSTESPKLASHHHRRKSSALTDDGETVTSEDLDHLEGSHYHYEDSEGERNSHRRRRSALLRRFGDLIMRKSFIRREASTPPDQ